MIRSLLVCTAWLCAMPWIVAAEIEALTNVETRADLEAIIARTTNPELQQALREHTEIILAAAQQRPHLQKVLHAIMVAPGKVVKVNTTPESLKRLTGGDLALFDTLTTVDLAVPNAGPHDKRTTDPYDADFFAHLGHISALESLNIIATKLNDESIAPLAKLANLKVLRFTNNGKLSDVGLAKLANLKNLETFSFVGTSMQGHAIAQFEGWTRLTRCSFRGSSIDDVGLQAICDQFPNLESISLAHAKCTDAGVVHLKKLGKLKSLELGSRNASGGCLKNLHALPLEYLQLGDGLDTTEGIKALQAIPTLRRLTLTGGKNFTAADMALVASLTQLEQIELGGLALSDERLSELRALTFLKKLQLVDRPRGYPVEIQAKIIAHLPQVEVTFP